MTKKEKSLLLITALVVWGLCGATIAIGQALTSMEATLIIHAVMAPVFSGIGTYIYLKKVKTISPLSISLTFLLFIMIVDASVVAPVFQKSYDLFRSFLGTWLPFLLIFLASYVTATVVNR